MTRRSHSVTDASVMALIKGHDHADEVRSEAASDPVGPPRKPRHRLDSMHGAPAGQMRHAAAAREIMQTSSGEPTPNTAGGASILAYAPGTSHRLSRSSSQTIRAWSPRRRLSSCPTGHRQTRPRQEPTPTLPPAERRRFSLTIDRYRPWPTAEPLSAP